jgi:hypothetical protein
LWEAVYDAIDGSDDDLVGHHCYSHLGPKQVGSKVEGEKTITAADWLGNGLTDHLADKVAEWLQPLPYDAARFGGNERRAFTVLRRLAFIEADCIRAAPEEVPLAPEVITEPTGVGEQVAAIWSGLENAGHSLYTDGKWVRCKVSCKRRQCKFERCDKLPCCRGGLAALGKRKADGQLRNAKDVVDMGSQASETDAKGSNPSEDHVMRRKIHSVSNCRNPRSWRNR